MNASIVHISDIWPAEDVVCDITGGIISFPQVWCKGQIVAVTVIKYAVAVITQWTDTVITNIVGPYNINALMFCNLWYFYTTIVTQLN